jgi:hypothetical protein
VYFFFFFSFFFVMVVGGKPVGRSAEVPDAVVTVASRQDGDLLLGFRNSLSKRLVGVTHLVQ